MVCIRSTSFNPQCGPVNRHLPFPDEETGIEEVAANSGGMKEGILDEVSWELQLVK